MGSSTKKHKKDRDVSKKHKHKSRSRSRSYEEPYRERELFRDSSRQERDREAKKHNKKHHKEKRHRSGAQSDRDRYERERHREHRSREKPRAEEYISDDSDDCVEVPIAPPAPPISSSSSNHHHHQSSYSSRKSRSASPIPENGAGDCLSIADTNKLRAKLGLKPLEVETGPINRKEPASSNSTSGNSKGSHNTGSAPPNLNQYKDDFGEFYHKPADNMAEKKTAEKIRSKLNEKREKRKVEEKLTRVKALGDSDGEEDIQNWVEKSRQKERLKEEASRRAKMLEEMDAEFGVSNLVDQETRNAKRDAYKMRDLKGLRVEHDVDEFSEGRDVILTLKDKDVLAEDDDALVNVNMIDNDRYKKNVENRKANPQHYGYNVYADETVDEFGQIISRPILGKYDEDIDGNRKKASFTIGEHVDDEIAERRKLLEVKSKLQGKKLETLDDSIVRLASEYFSPEEMAFKKPKKKVKKLRQKLKADDLLAMAEGSADMVNQFKSRAARNGILDTDDVPATPADVSNVKYEEEDDDLQRMLSKARRMKQKEALIKKPLEIEPKPEVKSEPNSDDDNAMDEGKEANITLDATAEFCRTLGDIPTYGLSGNRDEEVNEMMDFEQELEERSEEPEEIESSVGVWSSVNPDAERDVAAVPIELSDVAILDEEPDVSTGVAAALRLAVSKGYLEKEEYNRPSGSRMAHLQAKNYSIEDKTHAEDEKFGRRERYHAGPTVDFKEKETFKPNVKLEYIDDGGRLLNAKEAFRYLSHKFHGKGPGKNKIEKRLKKMEQDVLMMKMNSTDTPLGTLNMLQQKQRETQSPYIVLSGSKQAHANASIVKPKMK